MAKNLVIIEAPGKLPKFKKALGNDYDVRATVGHCVDLPEKSLAIDLKKNFQPTWEVKDDKQDVVNGLKAAAKLAEKIYLMTDEDREGEAIAWHIAEQIKETKAQVFRATTNEITESGIKKAINNPGTINLSKINAYLCRRLMDRLCGYKTSFLTYQASGGKSAGRVQSAILRVIVDREKEILHFVPEEYWILTANLLSEKKESYTGILNEKIKVANEQEANQIYSKVIAGSPVVTSVDIKQVNANPYAPFTTIPMQATASTLWGWSGKKTMQVAQNLYQEGLITYHRTDAPFMAKEAVDMVRSFIDHSYGAQYLPSKPNVYAAKKGAQEAHECCRVTDVHAHPAITGDDQKLYELIWKRTVSSQMTPGIDERVKVVTEISGYEFISRGNRLIFDGYRRVWDVGKSKDAVLPVLKEGEKCTLSSLDKEQKFTQPPDRYSVASLGKKCEENQLARPATFSNFIETLLDRKYIQKKGNSFQATDLGIKVIDFLSSANFCFVDIKFTSEMEELLDQIQSNTKQLNDVMNEFWTRLQLDIANGKNIKKQQEVTAFPCPKCNGKLLKKHSKFGSFFSCENYKPPKKVGKSKEKVAVEGSCPYIAKVGEHGEPVEKVPKVKEYATFNCNKCGSKMVKRSSKHGEFYGCDGFPKCRTVADLDGTFKEPKKTPFKKFYKKKSTELTE